MTWFRILEGSRGILASVFMLPWQGQASIKDLIKSVSSCIISNPGAFAESWKCAHMATTDRSPKVMELSGKQGVHSGLAAKEMDHGN